MQVSPFSKAQRARVAKALLQMAEGGAELP